MRDQIRIQVDRKENVYGVLLSVKIIVIIILSK